LSSIALATTTSNPIAPPSNYG
jgi:hypothetical protein